MPTSATPANPAIARSAAPKQSRWIATARFACLAMTIGSAAAAAHAADENPIKVGHFASLTGKDASFGIVSRKGILLAVEEINAAGGLLGRPVEYLVEDIQSKAGESATAVKKLLSRDKVVAILGGNPSSNSLEAAPLCQRAGIPMMAISSTSPKVTAVGDCIFRICFIDPFQGAVLGRFARESLHARRLALLTPVTPYGVGLAGELRQKFTALGGEIVGEQKYAEGDKDFKAQLTALRSLQPDVIAVPGYYTEAALICRQARELGLTSIFIGGDGWEAPQLTELGGPAVEGAYYSTGFSADNSAPAVRDFVRRFRHRWDNTDPDSTAALGYDAMMLYADAIRRAGTTDRAALRAALASTRDFAGVTGRITIDKDRNATKSAVMMRVAAGRTEFVETVEP
jgi:branched-chain amino acid transport system substrate-binding protein